MISIGYAIPSFLFAVLLIVLFAGGSYLQWFPLRGLVSENFWSQLPWSRQDPGLFLAPGRCRSASLVVGRFATLTMLTKNRFLEEINKQYVLTARAKGLDERRVLYGHVFRNAMLIVIAGFPAAFFIGVLFTGSPADRDHLLARWPGPARLRGRDQARLSDRCSRTLYIFTLVGLLLKIVSDLTYILVDPRIDFEAPMSAVAAGAGPRRGRARRPGLPPVAARRRAGSPTSRPTGAATSRSDLFVVLFAARLFAELIANDRPLLIRYEGAFYFPVLVGLPRDRLRRLLRRPRPTTRDPAGAGADRGEGLDPLAADPLPLRHDRPRPRPTRALAAELRATGWAPTTRRATSLARLIYGFRISVLFGLVLTVLSSIVGVAAGAVQGYLRRLGRPVDAALHRDLERPADALSADHPVQHRGAELLVAARS